MWETDPSSQTDQGNAVSSFDSHDAVALELRRLQRFALNPLLLRRVVDPGLVRIHSADEEKSRRRDRREGVRAQCGTAGVDRCPNNGTHITHRQIVEILARPNSAVNEDSILRSRGGVSVPGNGSGA